MRQSGRVPTWGGRRATAALAHVKAEGRRHWTPCGRCGKPIDYSLEYPDRMSCSVGHIRSRRDWPELTWDPRNWRPEHLRCNQEETPEVQPPDLGVVSGW